MINIKKGCSIRNNELGASSANRGELNEHLRTDTQMSFIDQMASVEGKASASMASLTLLLCSNHMSLNTTEKCCKECEI